MRLKYLGSIIANSGTCDTDIKNRISNDKQQKKKALCGLAWNKSMPEQINAGTFT